MIPLGKIVRFRAPQGQKVSGATLVHFFPTFYRLYMLGTSKNFRATHFVL